MENSQIHDEPSLRKSCKSRLRKRRPGTSSYDVVLAILAPPAFRYQPILRQLIVEYSTITMTPLLPSRLYEPFHRLVESCASRDSRG
jgi:hypothetical protein